MIRFLKQFCIVVSLGLFVNPSAAPAEVVLEVMNPRGEISGAPYRLPNASISDLSSKRVALYWNGKDGGDNLLSALEEVLRAKYPKSIIIRYQGTHQISDQLADKIAKEADTFIYGVGD